MLWWMINTRDKEPFLLGCIDATQTKKKPFKDFKTFWLMQQLYGVFENQNCLCLKNNNPSLMIYMDSSWIKYLIFDIYAYQVGVAKITLTNWSPTSIIFISKLILGNYQKWKIWLLHTLHASYWKILILVQHW